MSEIITYRLDEIADVIDCEHKTAPKVDSSDYYSIRTPDIKNGRLLYEQANRVSAETYELWTKRGIPEAGDIILAREAPVGEVGWIDKDHKICLGQRTVLIKIHSIEIDKKYLLYSFVSPKFKDYLNELSGGSVVAHLNMKDIRALEFSFPPLPEQKAIASVLSSLDDKIDLLHRQNKTLEAMAETLFRQWFIEEAKEDWEEKTIGDIFTIKGGGTPSTKEPSYWDGSIAWTSPRDLSTAKSLYMFSTERTITELGLTKVSSGLLPVGTLLMSSRAPIGYLALTDIEVAVNQGYIAILKHDLYSNEFMYLWCKANMELIKNSGNGSVFQEISKTSFRELPFVCPPEPLLKEFNGYCINWFSKIKLNAKQIQTLENLRDTLLPKLMNGEVTVKWG